MQGARSRTHAPNHARAFSLVELLVAIAIIAILISVTLPTLRAAKASAQDAVCFSNLRVLGAAWHAYITDKGHFPRTPRSISNANLPELPPGAMSWGGAHSAASNPLNPALNTARPLNAYLSAEHLSKSLFEVFHCPRDTGAKYLFPNGTMPLGESLPYNFFFFPEHLDTAFGVYGNSYFVNDWIWAPVGSPNGGGPSATPNWNFNNSLDTIINPSRTVNLGDMGGIYPGAFTDEQHRRLFIPVGWWHGQRTSNIVMWDGSARHVKTTPGGFNDEYWLWLQPSEHPSWGTPMAGVPSGASPPPAN